MYKQPVSKNCFVCGRENPFGLKLDFYFDGKDTVTAEVNIPESYEGYPGVVHGGVITAILDECAGRAHMIDPNKFMVTAQLNVRFRKPVPTHTLLTVKGVAGERHGRVAMAHGEILDKSGEILAEADGVFVDIPENKLPSKDDYLKDWHVYPD
jgi:uncharacterized protein (TIGR00369 family)